MSFCAQLGCLPTRGRRHPASWGRANSQAHTHTNTSPQKRLGWHPLARSVAGPWSQGVVHKILLQPQPHKSVPGHVDMLSMMPRWKFRGFRASGYLRGAATGALAGARGDAAMCWAERSCGVNPAGPDMKAKASGMHEAAMAAITAVFPEIILVFSCALRRAVVVSGSFRAGFGLGQV